MPYRAMIWTIVTVGLALAAVALYVAAVEPMMAHLDAPAVTTMIGSEPSQETMLRRLVQGTMLLSFLLICLLLVVGFAATFREWVRFRTGVHKGRRLRSEAEAEKHARTEYVDAWKLAGDRLQIKKGDGSDEGLDEDEPQA